MQAVSFVSRSGDDALEWRITISDMNYVISGDAGDNVNAAGGPHFYDYLGGTQIATRAVAYCRRRHARPGQ